MKNKPYKVSGDAENGFRIAVPSETGVKKGDRYDFNFIFVAADISAYKIPAGSLVYVPHVDDNAGTGGSGKESTKKIGSDAKNAK